MTYDKYAKYVNFINKYKRASNASTGSEVDSNANVENKNVTTLFGELFKKDAIGINRLIMTTYLKNLFDEDTAKEYLRQLDCHEIYAHDETQPIYAYCVSITMYPFLFNGLITIGGISDAPKNLQSFCGSFVNLVFAVAAQFAGAVSTPEFLSYLDYFIRKEYGDDYYLHTDTVVEIRKSGSRTLDKLIEGYFQQVIHSINQPAAARNFQSVFWNIAYFDEPYFKGMFENFVFPDGSSMKWESVSWLQKKFMNWFNEERRKKVLTFPVETMNLLNDGKEYVDKEWADFTAEMYAKGHSFFTYTSNSVDSLASCCRLRNEIQDNTFSYTLGAGGVSTGSKKVITTNINRLVQNVKRANPNATLEDISEAVRDQAKKVHKYLLAYNAWLKDLYDAGLMTIYNAGYISLEKQFLTLGVNGFAEGAEFLGIEISPNDKYFEYVDAILRPIYEENKTARTKDVMYNTEFVPKMSGHKVA